VIMILNHGKRITNLEFSHHTLLGMLEHYEERIVELEGAIMELELFKERIHIKEERGYDIDVLRGRLNTGKKKREDIKEIYKDIKHFFERHDILKKWLHSGFGNAMPLRKIDDWTFRVNSGWSATIDGKWYSDRDTIRIPMDERELRFRASDD